MSVQHTLGEQATLCTGCGACAAACPVDAITMMPDVEGFLQPQVDDAVCIDCGLCREVCPVNPARDGALTAAENRAERLPTVWAAWNKDEEVRRQSSSGGVFSVLAEHVLEKGGVVVGAAFDADLVVRHCLIENTKDLYRLRGSKYVQSEISIQVYRRVSEILLQNRPVLFSGTPCQAAGIKAFLGKFCEGLFCCDIVCHGVPSRLLFDSYIKERSKNRSFIKSVHFRDKSTGWKKFNIGLQYSDGSYITFSMYQDPYMLAFLRDLALRRSCYKCKFTTIDRISDITLADFWGVNKKYPNYDQEDKGTSLVLVNTKKGKDWMESCRNNLFVGEADVETAVTGNRMLVCPASIPKGRDFFYADLQRLSFSRLIQKYQLHPPSLPHRIKKFIKRKIKNILVRLHVMK